MQAPVILNTSSQSSDIYEDEVEITSSDYWLLKHTEDDVRLISSLSIIDNIFHSVVVEANPKTMWTSREQKKYERQIYQNFKRRWKISHMNLLLDIKRAIPILVLLISLLQFPKKKERYELTYYNG